MATSLDIVERLRHRCLWSDDPLYGEAADEIERLRATVDACADYGDEQVAEIERLRGAHNSAFDLAVNICRDLAAQELGAMQCAVAIREAQNRFNDVLAECDGHCDCHNIARKALTGREGGK